MPFVGDPWGFRLKKIKLKCKTILKQIKMETIHTKIYKMHKNSAKIEVYRKKYFVNILYKVKYTTQTMYGKEGCLIHSQL